MIRTLTYFIVFLIATPAMLFMSCTQQRQPCLTPKTASLLMRSVQVRADTTPVDSPLNAAVFIPLTGDSVLTGTIYARSSNFTLSLSPLSDTCSWVFATDTAAGSLLDTLRFQYGRQLNFISNACGYGYHYNLVAVQTTHNNIDSVRITNTSVTNNVKTSHLQVYIHPAL